MSIAIRWILPLATCSGLVACGGDSDPPPVNVGAMQPGATPFIAFVPVQGAALATASSLSFTIAPATDSASRPIHVSYSIDYLVAHGYATPSSTSVTLPVFGLYAGTSNDVTITVMRAGSADIVAHTAIATAAWADPHAIYDHPVTVQARPAGSALGFDFFFLKSAVGTPVVVDTDGKVRWIGSGVPASQSSLFRADGFEAGGVTAPALYRMEFDGQVTTTAIADPSFVNFNHDFEPGKAGILGQIDAMIGGQLQTESILKEFTPEGTVLATWNLGQILSDYMTAQGDDPSRFVRPPIDWFHMNTAIYDARDDSVIVSSRENFLIKLDYRTQAIRWIFGDTSKYWYTFPSLRAKALTFVGDGLVPIGQHSVNIAPDGTLLLFNNGYASLNQPAAQPEGQSRTYSAVSDYSIDETARTATENWHYDHGQTYDAVACSSARQMSDGSLLIDYSTTDNVTTAHVVGLDASRAVVFDYRYPTHSCDTAFQALPLALDAMTFQ
jgi:hypothetical protein